MSSGETNLLHWLVRDPFLGMPSSLPSFHKLRRMMIMRRGSTNGQINGIDCNHGRSWGNESQEEVYIYRYCMPHEGRPSCSVPDERREERGGVDVVLAVTVMVPTIPPGIRPFLYSFLLVSLDVYWLGVYWPNSLIPAQSLAIRSTEKREEIKLEAMIVIPLPTPT